MLCAFLFVSGKCLIYFCNEITCLIDFVLLQIDKAMIPRPSDKCLCQLVFGEIFLSNTRKNINNRSANLHSCHSNSIPP